MVNDPVAEIVHGELTRSDVFFRLLPVGGVDVFFQIPFFVELLEQAKGFTIAVVHGKWCFRVQLLIREVGVACN
ncbi:hypothetical protein D3C78_1595970 [compost metagenome]